MTAAALRRSPFVLPALAALAAIAMTAGAPAAQSAASKTCSLSEREQDPPGDVPTYNLSVKVTRSSCTTAKRVAKAFHKCRPASGWVCSRKVLARWTCTGAKDSSSPVMFYAHFTCRWGVRRVTSSYAQNTS